LSASLFFGQDHGFDTASVSGEAGSRARDASEPGSRAMRVNLREVDRVYVAVGTVVIVLTVILVLLLF
jgi:hypothetical protein